MTSVFRLDQHPIVFLRPRLSHPYGWVGHIPFAYLLIDLLRPTSVVELGTHSGNSYLAFCQAVAELGLGTRCTAVDSWEGDAHARQYGSEVLAELRAFHDPRYGRFSHLSQKLFDAAANDFEDNSIDLLHIDGLHTYEAVRNDFETWLPKLSAQAVVILHDAEVKDRNFGVWKFVEELAARYRVFQFRHSNGLAVVEVGSRIGEPFTSFMDHALANPEEVRSIFERLAGTLLDGEGRPVSSSSAIALVPVTCRLYLRGDGDTYSEESSLQQALSAPEGSCELEIPVGDIGFPDFVRVDFSETPGVFGVAAIAFVAADGDVFDADRLESRISRVNGELLPSRALGTVRLVSFDEDPHVEFDVRDVAAAAKGRRLSKLALRLDYELVASDPVMWRLLDEAGKAISELRLGESRVAAISVALDGIASELRGSSSRTAALHDRVDGRLHLLGETIHALSDRTMTFNEVLSATNNQLHQLTQESSTASAGAAAMNATLAEATSHLHHLLQQSGHVAAVSADVGQGLQSVTQRLELLAAETSNQASGTGAMNRVLTDATTQLHSLSQLVSSSVAGTGLMNQVLADATTQLHSLSQLVSNSASGTGMMSAVLTDAVAQLRGLDHLLSGVAADVLSRSNRHEEALASLVSLVREQSRQIQVLGDVLASHGQTLEILNSVRPMQRLKRLFGRK
jgi:hypothetical protein